MKKASSLVSEYYQKSTRELWIDDRYNRSFLKNALEAKKVKNGHSKGGLSKQEIIEDPTLKKELPSSGLMCKASFETGNAWETRSMEEALASLENMPEFSSMQNLIWILQNCRKSKNLEYAKRAHAHIFSEGLEAYRAVGNYIVPMFVECGSISDAQQVFDRLVNRNEHSWTSLILGYIKSGRLQHALELYQKMRVDDIYPSSFTLVGILKACARLEDAERGREFYHEVAQKGFEKDLTVVNTLIGMYAKCGLLSDALEAFKMLPSRTVVSWTALIAGYAEHGPGEEALKCFSKMQEECISPNVVTFSCVLKACGSTGTLSKGRELHIQVAQMGVEKDLPVGNTLVSMYAKCGLLLEAWEVFDKLAVRDVVSWTALMVGYLEHGYEHKAVSFFEQMESEGIPVDSYTLSCALKACGNLGAIDKGWKMHIKIVQEEFESEPCVGNSLIGMYAKCGLLSEAQEVFDELQSLNVISWAALVSGYADHGLSLETLKLLELMQLKGASPNDLVFVSALKACGGMGNLDKGMKIHTNITHVGFGEDAITGSTLVDMYAKCGSLLEAQAVLEKLTTRNVISWTALIGGYAEHGPGQEALTSFELMKLEGISPTATTFSCVLKACGSIGAIHKGRYLHLELTQKGFEGDQSVCNSLMSMYIKCGSVSRAREVFDTLFVQNIVAWSSMIKGYGLNHDGHMVVHCFKQMQEQGVKPNAITFTCLLTACSHASLVVKGQEYFNIMREEYDIAPTVEHYTCMVDLLARSGHLYEAEKFLEMCCSPSERMWAALLSACKTHGEVERGVRCFQQLVQMNSKDAAWYVLMAEIYASSGRWDDAYRIEEMSKRAGVKKKPAFVLMEINKKVHEFVVGDNQSKEALSVLENLRFRIKQEGHVANLDLVYWGGEESSRGR